MRAYTADVGRGFAPDRSDSVEKSLLKQYERVFFESLITTFGLDAFIRDQHGGDMDTIHNVRQIGKDERMGYKNPANAAAWEARGAYDSHTYHSHDGYIARNREVSALKKEGRLRDAYTGEAIARNGRTDLDHIIAAREIHEDRGRVLAGLKGEDLANSPENLVPTNPRANRSKKADSMEDFLKRRGGEYSAEQQARMRKLDAQTRKAYNARLGAAYYTSDFWQDAAMAAGKVGMQMGVRQAAGFVLAEVWFAVREKMAATHSSKFRDMLLAAGEGVREGGIRAKQKFGHILSRFSEGVAAGLLSSLITTLCNIFFTTARHIVRILRQTFATVVAAGKVLLFNPDNLLFGDRMKAALTILAVGASAVAGIMVSEFASKAGLAAVPVIGDTLVTFLGVLVSGLLSCGLVYFLDNCDVVKRAVSFLNKIHTVEYDIAFYRKHAAEFEQHLETLLAYDLEGFQREAASWRAAVHRLEAAGDNPAELSRLDNIMAEQGISKPWTGDFNDFMGSKKQTLTFE